MFTNYDYYIKMHLCIYFPDDVWGSVCVCVILYSSDVHELRLIHYDATMQLFSR